MGHYSIKDLEKLSGIKAQTIRVWERRFNIIKPSRTETNRRRYGDFQLRKIINISILHRNGFKISLIASLSDHEIEEKVNYLSKDSSQSDTQIDSLIKSSIAYNENEINDLLIRSIINIGFEDTITKIVLPFLNRFGVMWQTGSADVGSEHFVTNIIRNRIILSIESLTLAKRQEAKKFILFLPENELHEIGLLYFTYILRKEGHETLYLGQSTPLESVVSVNNQWKADFIVTGLMTGFPGFNPDYFLSQLSISFPDSIVLVSGILSDIAVTINIPNIFPVKSANDLRAHLNVKEN